MGFARYATPVRAERAQVGTPSSGVLRLCSCCRIRRSFRSNSPVRVTIANDLLKGGKLL